MRKYFKILIVVTLISSLSSCNGFFDVKPTDIITDDDVWINPSTIENILTDLYVNIQLEDFNYYGFYPFDITNLSIASDESFPSWQGHDFGQGDYSQNNYGDEWFSIWPYDQIRNCNTFISRIEAAPITDEEKVSYIAEVRFIRAFHYFQLVKRFGGVPILEEAQEFDGSNIDDLQMARDNEQDVWDFIDSELSEIAGDLPQSRDASQKNRANKYIAFALKSRANLYAASIAEYAKVDLNGLVGVAAESTTYWQAAYDSSDSVLSSGMYGLYDNYSDKAENYQQLFLDRANNEYIWAKEYVLPTVAHSFDKRNYPYSFAGGYGCGNTPTLELVESYEYIDDRDGALKTTDASGNYIEYLDPLDLFANKDPRLFATVFLPNMPFRGDVIEIRRGMYQNGEYIKSNDAAEVATLADGKEFLLLGKDGVRDIQDDSGSGFYQKKFINEDITVLDMKRSDQSWPIFRLAEMYLNKAEAAFMLGKTGEALTLVNAIRNRAGIQELGTITLDDIKHERRIELAFENHRFWDLRRWRDLTRAGVAEGNMSNYKPTGLHPYIVYDNGNYIFRKVSSDGDELNKPRKIFLERNYYVKISNNNMNSNSLFIQNPGY